MVRKKYFQFIFIFFAIMGVAEKKTNHFSDIKFFVLSDSLVSLMQYNIYLSKIELVNHLPGNLQHLAIYLFTLSDQVYKNILRFLIDYKSYILYQYTNKKKDMKEDKNNIMNNVFDKKIIQEVNQIISNNINLNGFDSFYKILKKFCDNNFYIQYQICILKPSDVTLVKAQLNNTDMKQIIDKYCIFNFVTSNKEKAILDTCPMCVKKEIRKHLETLEINEKKIIYLKSYGRYVVLQRLKDRPLDIDFGISIFKSLYIKYGLSLYWKFYQNKEISFSEWKLHVLYILHLVFCN